LIPVEPNTVYVVIGEKGEVAQKETVRVCSGDSERSAIGQVIGLALKEWENLEIQKGINPAFRLLWDILKVQNAYMDEFNFVELLEEFTKTQRASTGGTREATRRALRL
jgi:hypothetical protein